MSVTINGTTGITTPDITTDDLTVDTNTLYVDATNNRVGIGTSSPTTNVTISPSSIANGLDLAVDPSNATRSGRIFFSNGTAGQGIAMRNDGGALWIGTGATAGSSSGTERMRIDSDGRLLVNQTSTNGQGYIQVSNTGGSALNVERNGSGPAVIFYETGSDVGSIDITASSTSYTTSSDYRLKENVVPMSGSIDRLKQLKPSTWSWLQDGSHGEGFLAHEAQTVVPEAVSGTKDAVDDEGNPVYQGIDQSKLVPLLTSALQEAITKIEALEARIATLEGN